MTDQEIKEYWAAFYADVDEMIASWREKYDPDGELDLADLAAIATEREKTSLNSPSESTAV